MKHIYQVEGMHCASCVIKIKTALQGLADSVEVTLNPPQAVLEGEAIADLKKLNAAVANAGNYTLTLLETPFPEMKESKSESKSIAKTYFPLLMIIAMITISSFAGANTLHEWMLHFMAAFFLVFGSFKLLDLRGFKDAYATYDVLAKHWKDYGYIYPFLELGLGFAFLFQVGVNQALWFSLFLMTFSSLGVFKALLDKRKIRCACLGTALNLPMSHLTLIEDLSMVAMAIAMLLKA